MSANSRTSEPAQNARVPAPVNTTARTVSSASSLSSACPNAMVSPSVTTFIGGLFSVRVAIPSLILHNTKSVFIALLSVVGCRSQVKNGQGAFDHRFVDHGAVHRNRPLPCARFACGFPERDHRSGPGDILFRGGENFIDHRHLRRMNA